MSPRVTTNGSIELVSSYETDLQPNQRYILDAARSRLLFLEHNIARRYLKPPLGRRSASLLHIDFSSDKRLMCRAHSFPRAAEFRAEPRNLGFYEPSRGIYCGVRLFCRGIPSWARGIRLFPQTLAFFIGTTQKMTSMLMAD